MITWEEISQTTCYGVCSPPIGSLLIHYQRITDNGPYLVIQCLEICLQLCLSWEFSLKGKRVTIDTRYVKFDEKRVRKAL